MDKPLTDRALFHWSPIERRAQILRYGLRPLQRPTTSIGNDGWRQPVICFADTPSWAWGLSAGMRWTSVGFWDLWQTSLLDLVDAQIIESTDRPSGIHEVRTPHRVYKRNLWHVGTREKR